MSRPAIHYNQYDLPQTILLDYDSDGSMDRWESHGGKGSEGQESQGHKVSPLFYNVKYSD